MIDKEYIDKGMLNFKKSYTTEDLFHEYLGFSQFVQGCFISKAGYITDTGNFQTVNYELMYLILERIKKHPLVWKLFFMVA